MEQHGAKLPILLAVGCLILLLVGFLKEPGIGSILSKSSTGDSQEVIGNKTREKYIVVIDAGHPSTLLGTEIIVLCVLSKSLCTIDNE